MNYCNSYLKSSFYYNAPYVIDLNILSYTFFKSYGTCNMYLIKDIRTNDYFLIHYNLSYDRWYTLFIPILS